MWASLLWVWGAIAAEPSEAWFAVEVQGQPAGWVHETITRTDLGWRWEQTFHLEIRRGEQAMVQDMHVVNDEDPTGRPIRMAVHSESGGATADIIGVFSDAGVAVEATQAGRTTTQQMPWRPECTGTVALRDAIAARLAAGERQFTLCGAAAMSPKGGSDVTYTVHGPDTVDVLGVAREATRVVWAAAEMPGLLTTDWLGPDGASLRSEVPMGSMRMVLRRSDGPVVIDRPPELMVETFVPTDPIRGARAAKRASYRLALDGADMADVPTTGVQRARRAHGVIDVHVDTRKPVAASDADDLAWRGRSLTIDTDDPELRALVDRALADVRRDDPAAVAEALRRFVFHFIWPKNLASGFATASEVARSHAGDCTEHAVLLVALLRIAGIPARGVTGVVYMDAFLGEDHVFGYHAWAQALVPVNGALTWVDLDAALSPTQPFDATHIALAVSALGDGDLNRDMAALVQLMGRLRIAVTGKVR